MHSLFLFLLLRRRNTDRDIWRMTSGLLGLFNDFSSWAGTLAHQSIFDISNNTFDPVIACAGLKSGLPISNVTVLDAIYYDEPANVSTSGIFGTIAVEVPLCRLEFAVSTSETSSVRAEAWLPSEWNGRFLAVGNGGLGGYIEYPNLAYGSKLHFATVGSNNGHDGDTGKYFVDPEVLADFTSRSIHVETVVGKQIISHYYGKLHDRSYYMGCSTGGRQGTYAALHYPDDFDGILVGAPATNFNNLLGWSGMLTKYLGATDGNSTGSWLSNELWDIIGEEILRQCDGLDGVEDGVITEPDNCNFDPDVLRCSEARTDHCLTVSQLEAIRKIYSTLYGENGELLFPRFDPGAEMGSFVRFTTFHGGPYGYWLDWMRYVVKKDANWSYSSFVLDDIYLANKADPGLISTFSGDLSEFKARGGKFLTYHGSRDDLIPIGNSKRYYNLVSETLGVSSLDSFYRLFLVPGLEHCFNGTGAINIGQYLHHYKSDDPKSNILLALVDWVENGASPDTITGLSDDGTEERVHCRYPHKSTWDGKRYNCV